MNKRAKINFISKDNDIKEPVTKFGGQPVWIDGCQWPISKELDEPMTFIGQIKLEAELFPEHAGKMAYLFMTDGEVDTWEPDCGENAVIIQPNGHYDGKVSVIQEGQSYSEPHSVNLEIGFDPASRDGDSYDKYSEDDWDEYRDEITGTKLAGTPGYIQYKELPDENQPWTFLLQLDSMDVPFEINFGDAGVAYVYINQDGTIGKMLWQCC